MPVRRAVLVLVAFLAGCGTTAYNHDVRGFTQAAKTPEEVGILRTIATYRMTKDPARACSLITTHFLQTSRFDGKFGNCVQVLRSADKHLPDSARVDSVSGNTARVRIAEPTATRSIYLMRREAGTWKIDDIVEAR